MEAYQALKSGREFELRLESPRKDFLLDLGKSRQDINSREATRILEICWRAFKERKVALKIYERDCAAASLAYNDTYHLRRIVAHKSMNAESLLMSKEMLFRQATATDGENRTFPFSVATATQAHGESNCLVLSALDDALRANGAAATVATSAASITT